MVPVPEADYQEALFILPPNPVNSPDRREISVVSANKNSINNEDEDAWRQCIRHNELHATWREGEAAVDNAEADLLVADRHNPRVAPRRPVPPTARNLDVDFILKCDGQKVFATPSANLAAAFEVLETLPHSLELKRARTCHHVAAAQVQRLRKVYLALRAQSNNSRHSTAQRPGDDEVYQSDLRANLNNRDLGHAINNHHREHDEAERERRRKYDKDYGPPSANRCNRGRRGHDDQQRPPRPLPPAPINPYHQSPSTSKPVSIDKFDSDSDPKTWIRTYSIIVHSGNGNNDIMAAYFSVMMSRQALN
ncbi:hypothetical protein C2845_PM16G03910 [Panicum miliaceum]|uniref:Uncharacterized protein n=1 Tax=Panicum miliaceum TaxID=4540 RepID=A0A3L6PU86_PANMI|nr:hypothetical protein C2845_PM16G03910 [Panicum miliaceum]